MRLKRGTICTLVSVLIFLAVFFAASGSVFATTFFTTNTSTDIGTATGNAIELSVKAYPSGASAAVVTSSDDWTKAMGASVLARAYGGPLLLSSSWSLSSGVSTELKRLKPTVVFTVGLSASTSASIDSALAGLSPRPQVIALNGSDAYETAALVAQQVKTKLGSVSKVVIVPSDYSGGVLAASAMAAANGWPILLTPVAGPFPQVSTDAIEGLGVTSGIIVGTTVAPVIDGFSVEKTLTSAVSGADPDGRFSLCAKTAEYAVSQGYSNYTTLGVAEAYERSGGMVVSTYVARNKGVLLVSPSTGLSWDNKDFMWDHGRDISEVSVVGLSWDIVRQVKSLNAARIYSVTPGSGPVTGGTQVVVTGTGLDTASSVIIGKTVVPAANWRVDSSSQLTITSTPEAYGAGPAEIIVQNYWNRSPATIVDVFRYADGGPTLPGDKVVEEALKYLGVKYVWAGSTPTGGFDCSGLAMYVYSKFGISLPHYSRAQAGYGVAVSRDELLPGDLVFFSNPISHVGIYVGGGLMINAPRSGDLVTIENVDRSSYNTARRLISPYTRYADTDYRLSAVGAWGTATSSSASGGSFSYLNSPGVMTVKFNGTYLGWVAKVGPQYGKARVTVDNGTPVTVDMYSSTTQYQKTVWNTGTLSAGVHTVTIEWTGTKNAASSSYYIDVDALDLLGELVQARETVRYEQTDERLAYTGSWTTWYAATVSGNSFYYTQAAGKVTIAFDGTYMDWVAQKGPLYGKASVTLDGGTPQTVDLYDASYLGKQVVYRTAMLSDGPHTVTIEWTGTKNAAASNNVVNIDAVDVIGELTDASLLPTGSDISRFEQTDPDLAYEGTWKTWYADTVSGNSFYYTEAAGKVTIAFDGTYMDWVAQKGPLYGKAAVTLDGGTPQTVDLYDASYLGKQVVYRTAMLSDGPHTVTIEWTGTKNAAASNNVVNIDAVDLIGELTEVGSSIPVPTVERYEETEPLLDYLGSWKSASVSGASGGTCVYVGSSAELVVGFNGTSLDWLAEKSKYYGVAKVTLDDRPTTQVDLYSATTLYQQRVFSTGELEDGEHTLTIEWTGAKNPSAAGTCVGVDAFDIAGELTEVGSSTPVPAATRYEETDPLLGYLGSWNSASVAGASGGTCEYVCSSARLVVGFEGTSLDWLTEKSKYYGIAEVTLDDEPSTQVDLYSATTLYQQRVFSTGELEDGEHTLTIEWTGAKNPSAAGNCIGVDAFDIEGELVEAPGITRYEQDAAEIAYSGSWAPNSWGAPASGASSWLTNTFGSSATVKFDGCYIGWITKKSPYYGHAMLFLDDQDPVTVDLYDSQEIWQQRVWNSGVLEEGEHTLTIQWSFGRNQSALDTNLSIDAFDIMGTIEQATPTVKASQSTVVVIDPGHQAHANYDLEPIGPGSSTMKAKVSAGTASVNTGSPESELNLALGLKLKDVLQGYGIDVVMTRETQDVDISNAQRAQLANSSAGDVFVRIHADGSTDSSVNGVLVLYPATIAGWTDDIASDSLRAATLALQEMTKATGAKSRGLSRRSDIAGFNWSDVPVFLAEVGLMTNATEDALLATDAYRDKIVAGLAKSVLCYLDFY